MDSNKQNKVYDILIIGGGINGTGIARDASGRGLSVMLCEQFDLANETSSRSSKMIHGGLRYLEYYEFRLVREALAEREVMLQIAPPLVQPLQLIIPHNKLQRPAWLIRLGLFLYDRLGKHFGVKSRLPNSHSVSLRNNGLFAEPLQNSLKKGFSYYDCKVDDARLVVLNAVAADNQGGMIKPHTKFISATQENNLWVSTLENQHTHEKFIVKSKVLVNAAGPWVDDIVNTRLAIKTKHQVELVKGSHIVIPKFYQGQHAYLLQHQDKRVIFVIPYHQHFTMIGTTDIPYHGNPETVAINEKEREYLCDIVNQYFKKTITPHDIVNEWSGVRPLQADDANNPSAVTRDYSLEIEDTNGQTPILSIFGGKITTYRKLAQHAMKKLEPYFPNMKGAWTATTPLPGGNIGKLEAFIDKLQQDFHFLPAPLLERYAYSYGSLSYQILEQVHTVDDLGTYFGAGLYAKELDYLRRYEWAQTSDDILWRRTKLGLQQQAIEMAALNAYLSPGNAT